MLQNGTTFYLLITFEDPRPYPQQGSVLPSGFPVTPNCPQGLLLPGFQGSPSEVAMGISSFLL